MPNWCENIFVVRGKAKLLAEFDEAFKGLPAKWADDNDSDPFKGNYVQRENPNYCFNALYPVPEEIIKAGYSAAGYEWCWEYWGTKWDIYSPREHDVYAEKNPESRYIKYYFDTAWSPPLQWLEKVAADWPGLEFELYYYEPGVGFAGVAWFAGGSLNRDYYIEPDHPDWKDFVSEHFGDLPEDEEAEPSASASKAG